MNKIKQITWFKAGICLFLWASVTLSCNRFNQQTTIPNPSSAPVNSPSGQMAPGYTDPFKDLHLDDQLMTVLRRIFQDSKGNLWFVGDNVYCWNGDSLLDFSAQSVFRRTAVRQMVEDQQGNIWFATMMGIVRYTPGSEGRVDTTAFTVFDMEDGLVDYDVWSLAVDAQDNLWVGTLGGVSFFDGKTFRSFAIPPSEPDSTRGVSSAHIVHSIREDRKGKIWFATNGGAYFYDGISLAHISEAAGLCHNGVNDLLEDQQGNIWFATHHAGVCRWNGRAFDLLSTELGIKGTEAWSLYEDPSGAIWFPIEHEGVYRYAQDSLTQFHKAEGLPLNNVHTVLVDQNGLIWVGGFGGLYRYEGNEFVNMTREGPWR